MSCILHRTTPYSTTLCYTLLLYGTVLYHASFPFTLLYIHPATPPPLTVRAPITWELLAPVPAPQGSEDQAAQDADRAKRAKYIQKLIATRKSMGDHALERIHEIGTMALCRCDCGSR